MSNIVLGQTTPGGVSGVNIEYWLRADEVSPTLPLDGADVTFWKDLSGNNRDFQSPNAFHPRFIKSSMNFHSAVDFYFLDSDDGGPSNDNNRRRKLQSIQNFPVDPNKSYFVLWISEVDLGNTGTYASVFSLSSNRGDNFGWMGSGSSAGKLWDEIRGTNYIHSGIANGYGIGMAIIPNKTGTGAFYHQLYNNSFLSTTGQVTRLLYNEQNRVSVIGNSRDGSYTDDYFFGQIHEIIVMSKPAGTMGATLTDDEIKKINSYLAIKYGLTLNTVQKNYMLSNGVSVYDSGSTGYTAYGEDIFGIARDDASGLYQKQSTSDDNPVLTVYLEDLVDTNLENTGTLTDKFALMFGSNGLDGFASYQHQSGTQYLNYTFQLFTDPITGVVQEERVSSLFNYKLRAKTTGQNSFTVNVRPGLGEWLLIGSDPNFTPSNTRIYKVEDGKVENLIINNGDYIGFAFYLKAPGGVVNGLKMWLNASEKNTITLNSAGEVVNWVDYSGFGTTYSKIVSNSTAPLFIECDPKLNFHQGVNFRKRDEYLSTLRGPMSVHAPNDYTFFTTLYHNFDIYRRAYFVGFGNTTSYYRPSLGFGKLSDGDDFYSGQAYITGGGNRFDGDNIPETSRPRFNPGATTITYHHIKKNNFVRFEIDAFGGQLNSSSAGNTGQSSSLAGPGTLGVGGANTSRNLLGSIGEVIAFESELTQLEKNKINSYLGLKYAITIDLDKTNNTNNFDFLFSDGAFVWRGNDQIHQSFHNNIASLVRDDDGNLHNKQSKSTDEGAIVHMGIGKVLGTNPDLSDIAVNKTSLTWGHNNRPVDAYSFAGNPDVCGEMDYKLNGRVWLVDNKNFNQEVILRAGGEDFPYAGFNYQVFLLVADSEQKLIDNNWDQIVPMSFVDDQHQVNYKFSDDFTYFTFGAKQVGGCDGCNFDGVKSIDFTRSNWGRGDLSNVFNLGDDFNVHVNVEDPNDRLSNRYPRNSSLSSLRERRRGGAGEITTKVSFKDDGGGVVSSIASFELFDIDREGSVFDNVQVIGYCNGSPVYPKLSYMYRNPERSRYTIEQQGNVKAKSRGVRYSGNSGYTNPRGRVFVEFEAEVSEIHIKYNPTTSSSSSSYIGIGPMEFYCPVPLPVPNEDGLIFVKRGPAEVKICDVVDYTFQVVNTNCSDKEINFSDILPSGMTWVNESLLISQIIPDQNISGYLTNTLTVNGIIIPGGGSVYTFRASAIFDENATAGIYQNQATINYDRLGVNVNLESTDWLTGNPFTETLVTPANDRPKQVAAELTLDKSCFKYDGEIQVSLNIDNPNTFDFSDMFLAFDYEELGFELIPNTIETSQGLNIGANQGENGSLEFEQFTLPSGLSWVKFKVRAASDFSFFDLIPNIDPNAVPIPDNVSFSFDLFSESDQDCLDGVFANAQGEIDLKFCTYCTQQPIGGTALTSDSGISTLKDQFSNWPENVPNGYLVLEAGKKGMVLTRTKSSSILNPEVGMIIYDTDNKCISIYNGTVWKCIERACNE